MTDQNQPPPSPEMHEQGDEERDDAIIVTVFYYSLGVMACLAIAFFGWWVWTHLPQPEVVQTTQPPELPEVEKDPSITLPQVRFADVTESSGVNFVHENGAYGDKLLPETMGGGCAFLDYNSDGHPDILLVNSNRWPWDPSDVIGPEPTMGLFENDGTGEFTDVTESAGLNISFYGQGCAVGDYDNDGDPDIFLSGLTERETLTDAGDAGPHRLLRNDDGVYTDVTAAAGVAGRFGDWGASCGWFDYDNDGDLDLWVTNYLTWSKEFDLAQDFQLLGTGGRGYGRPQVFAGSSSQLFRNDGDDQFTDVSAEAGIDVRNRQTNAPMAKSLGLGFADFDGDGLLDVVVSNDTVQNFLFLNQPGGTFTEIATRAGLAFDSNGLARGAMGLDIACAREESECFAVAIGNFSNEMTAFYVTIPGTTQFTDEAISNGLGPNTRLQLTFGVFFFDADLDGRLDLFAANGHLEEDISLVQASQTYEQPPQLFWNAGVKSNAEFLPLTPAECGDDLFRPMVGRGSAFADIDADGDLDVLIGATGGAPRLLRNQQSLGHHWVRFHLEGNGATSNRDAIGARVTLHAGDLSSTQFVMPTRSYLSQCERTVTFGLGTQTEIDRVEIVWPDGTRQELDEAAIDTGHVVIQAR